MNHVAKFWPLSDVHLGRNNSGLVFNSKTLYRLAIEATTRNFSNNPRCTAYREAIDELPLGIRFNVLSEMCDYPSLVDVQLKILSDPLLISDFIRNFSSDLTPLVQCLQWLESVKKSLPIQLFRQYKKLIDENIRTGGLSRFDYRCGLRIGTFLTETGWLVEAIGILQLTQQHAQFGTAEELSVLRQLMRAQTLAGKLINANKTYDRMKRMLGKVVQQRLMFQNLPEKEREVQRLQDLQAGVCHAFSLYHFEDLNLIDSYEYGMQSLSMISARSPSRLLVDVLRQIARACTGSQMYAKAACMLKFAIGLVAHEYGRGSGLYAETLEDLAILLLACNQVSESVDVYADAQHIYMQLYGARNLLHSIAQGNLAYGLYLQAYVTGRRDRALHHVTKAVENYKRILPPDHRMLTQARRLSVIMDLFTFGSVAGSDLDGINVVSINHKEIEALSVREVWAHFHEINKSYNDE
ncbi:amyloid protein-binding protein 2-like [Anopheles merus]|uniref:amyloid protein-binding protein 2-like n=1 Tax=Anopheles merus TaxID=30066 RepID=UPI001BE4196A|nr:amyloid protein-binding protein 2-like [Anopheles merus]